MFKSKLLVFFIFLSLASVAFLPVFTFTYLYPAIDTLLISNAEVEAKRLANHFSSFFAVPDEVLQRSDITPSLTSEINEIIQSFALEKVKVFSGTGEIIYSTDPADIGNINTKDYFRTLVLRGKNFTKIVRKDSKTLEGRTVSADVIETYVPISGRDRVVGAFEIYYDITILKGLLSSLIYHSSLIIYGISFILVSALFVSLFTLTRNRNARIRAEQELTFQSDRLEQLVEKRTRELREANAKLKEDIAKRRDVEKALQVSEEKYRSLVDMAGDPIFIADAETGIITDVNRKGIELAGRDINEIVGMHLSELHPKDEIDHAWMQTDDQESRNMPLERVLHVQHANGRRIPVEISSSQIVYGGRKMIQGIYRDISMRLQMEEERQKNEKLETASILAGTIAHDFNNILTAVIGNISMTKIELEDNDRLYKRLSDTESALAYAKDLTHRFLTFSRGNKPVKKAVALERVIEDAARFVLRGTQVKCTYELSPDLWYAEADAGKINHVIGNLVLNACQAMQGAGTCSIRASNIDVDATNKLLLPPGKYIRIIISDEGHGIDPDTLEKIFDPFFTTRDHGCGLGLSSTYSIIKNHGGLITVRSTPGQGTSFYVYLPAFEAEPAEEERKDLKGSGKILVMDDEDIVRKALTSQLEYLGYQVETAAEGRNAVAKYKKAHAAGEPFSGVIMDLTVPEGMGGDEAVLELRKFDQNARVIVSSGHISDPVLSRYKEHGFDGVVPKPYKIEELAKVVKETLSPGK